MKTHLPWILILLILVAGIVVLKPSCGRAANTADLKGKHTQKSLPGKTTADPKAVEVLLQDTNGNKLKLSSYRGKVVVVDIWATWCPYCVEEIPALMKLQDEYTKNGVKAQIIGMSVDRNPSDAVTYVQEHKVSYPVGLADAKALKPFGSVTGLPTKFILNDKGVIVDTIIGAQDIETVRETVAKYLPKK